VDLLSNRNESIDKYYLEVGDKILKRLDRTMAAIPCGLPVLPPHWVFTVNVWTYEVMWEYEKFIIKDKNEVPLRLGTNEMITFHFNGYSATVEVQGQEELGTKQEDLVKCQKTTINL
jgi:hypothetical protein